MGAIGACIVQRLAMTCHSLFRPVCIVKQPRCHHFPPARRFRTIACGRCFLAPLLSKSESSGSGDFSPLWSGQAARLAQELPAAELTRKLATEAPRELGALGDHPIKLRKRLHLQIGGDRMHERDAADRNQPNVALSLATPKLMQISLITIPMAALLELWRSHFGNVKISSSFERRSFHAHRWN